MTDNITALIEEARAFADRDNGFNWQGRVRELADALEAEHQRATESADAALGQNDLNREIAAERDRYREIARRTEIQCQDAEAESARYESEAESARKTGERILADALRYRAAIEEALHNAPGLGELRWRKVDQMVGILARALNEGDTDDH